MIRFCLCCIFTTCFIVQSLSIHDLYKRFNELHDYDIIIKIKYIEANKNLCTKIDVLRQNGFTYSNYVDNIFNCLTNQFVPIFIERKVGKQNGGQDQ